MWIEWAFIDWWLLIYVCVFFSNDECHSTRSICIFKSNRTFNIYIQRVGYQLLCRKWFQMNGVTLWLACKLKLFEMVGHKAFAHDVKFFVHLDCVLPILALCMCHFVNLNITHTETRNLARYMYFFWFLWKNRLCLT